MSISSEMKMSVSVSESVSVSMKKNLMERLMSKCIQEVVNSCAALYSFSADECLSTLLAEPEKIKKLQSKSKAKSSKATKSFPLPFMREHVIEDGCNGIIFNHGLFTQCKNGRTTESIMCNACSTENCGTLEARMSPDFKDPKGRRPSSYISVLRKLKLTQEQAIQEAGKVNIELNELHFVEQAPKVKTVKEPKVKTVKEPKVKTVKEPKVKTVKVVKEVVSKVVKEPKVKAVKVSKEKVGRPKSTKKAMETVTVEDLFASLVAEEVSDEEIELQEVEIVSIKEQELAAAKQLKADAEVEKALAKEQKKSDAKSESNERNEMHSADIEMKKMVLSEDKAIKLATLAAEKQLKAETLVKEKEAKVAAAALEKEAKVAAAALEKEAKVAAAALEKEAKALATAEARVLEKEAKAAALAEKAANLVKEKEAKALASANALAAAKQLKADALAAKAKPKAVSALTTAKEPEEKVAKITVTGFEFNGIKYFKSKENVVYDPKTREEIGIWNPITETIEELPEESDNEEVESDYESDTD
jgi:hypothetical protein